MQHKQHVNQEHVQIQFLHLIQLIVLRINHHVDIMEHHVLIHKLHVVHILISHKMHVKKPL